MGWTDWFKDSSGPGEVSEKVTIESDGTQRTEYLRTEDNTKKGDRDDHSHVIIRQHPNGSVSAEGAHGIRDGKRK